MTYETLLQNKSHKNTVLFLGFGYVAGFLADLLDKNNWHYLSLSTREKQFSFNQKIIHCNFDCKTLTPELLFNITHIIVTAPPTKNQDKTQDKIQDSALEIYSDLILKTAPNLKWLGYLSSTSVYGNHDGGVVTEISECKPTSDHGKNRLFVEQLWQDFSTKNQLPLHIFRLAGIYGPDRNTINDVRFSQTVNIIKHGHLMNRIHVKDIARALLLSMNNPTPHHIFNLADDMASSTAAMNDYIAFLLDKPNLPKVAYDDYYHKMSDMRKSFYAEYKIISNNKLKTMLKFALEFPTYREGIKDILEVELLYSKNRVH